MVKVKKGAEAQSGAPPSYDAANAEQPAFDITAGFASLNLGTGPQDPTPDSCLAHLKLLYAFQTLKEDIGYTDGLFGLWNTRAEGTVTLQQRDENGNAIDVVKDVTGDHQAQQMVLSQVREKRWALFIARAVDRYETWWDYLKRDRRPLQEDDMDQHVLAHELFPITATQGFLWHTEDLPPLDVLLVWHSHMLNPRAYLEDCLRSGLRELWFHGIPWDKINRAIDSSFNYNISDDSKAAWWSKTDRPWDNADDTSHKGLSCPDCRTLLAIPWTTCGADEKSKGSAVTTLIGNGYGDGDLDFACHGCGLTITKNMLSLMKFRNDTKNLLTRNIPMPGTVLNPENGKPEAYRSRSTVTAFDKFHDPLRFPNQLVRQVLAFQIDELISKNALPSMENIRKMIETTIRDSGKVNNMVMKEPGAIKSGKLVPLSRLAIRKMMSRYWDNFSPFALDLSGAVMRQGVFVEKMYRLDWLHSPVAPKTMSRICNKYSRFLKLMDSYPGKLCVPTLDVDLAWHTAQLSPSAYYATTTRARQGRFIDHDDKIDEGKLSEAFEWTSKKYQEQYNEVYSECTCWYCETVRSSHVSSIGRVLKMSENEKVANDFHDSGAAKLCPPENSAHISAHNAVMPRALDPNGTPERASIGVRNAARLVYQRRLNDNYQKAQKRAKKKGRDLPPREEYYSHWGYPYYMYGPYVYPVYFTPGMYYGADPNVVTCPGSGSVGACATGSCGGGVAAGACGCPGGCGNAGGCSSGGGDGGGGCGGGGGDSGGGGCGGGGCGGGGD